MGGHNSSIFQNFFEMRFGAPQRIIGAVKGDGRVAFPEKINDSRLGLEIELAWTFFREEASMYRSGDVEKGTRELVNLASKLATLIKQEMDAETYSMPKWDIGWRDVEPSPDLRYEPSDIQKLHDELVRFQRYLLAKNEHGLAVPDSNPTARLIGTDLANIYFRHFAREPGISRPPGGGAPYGPFVRFVQAIASEYDTEFSAETIAAYVRLNGKKTAKNS
jgi:hypothetical protein